MATQKSLQKRYERCIWAFKEEKNRKNHSQVVVEECDKYPEVDYVILRMTGCTGEGDTLAAHEMYQLVSVGLICFFPGS
jgi:hypothetical protein